MNPSTIRKWLVPQPGFTYICTLADCDIYISDPTWREARTVLVRYGSREGRYYSTLVSIITSRAPLSTFGALAAYGYHYHRERATRSPAHD